MPATSVDAYLERIGVSARPTVDLVGLTQLMQAHLSTVPFENIDVFRQTGVSTDVDWSLGKIVTHHRGGWCFENNGSFGWLLKQLGFATTYLGAFVLLPPADTVNMSHLCLRVDLDRPYLVDVGFGDSFIQPLPLEPGTSLDDGNEVHTLEEDGDHIVLLAGVPPEPQYRFTLTPRTLDEFEIQSRRLQTPGTSGFTKKPFATRLIDGGPDRVTLLQDRVRFRRDGVWTEQPISVEDWDSTALEWFGIDLT
jgi:N-hydroxyarylamine O-acetyltransferase